MWYCTLSSLTSKCSCSWFTWNLYRVNCKKLKYVFHVQWYNFTKCVNLWTVVIWDIRWLRIAVHSFGFSIILVLESRDYLVRDYSKFQFGYTSFKMWFGKWQNKTLGDGITFSSPFRVIYDTVLQNSYIFNNLIHYSEAGFQLMDGHPSMFVNFLFVLELPTIYYCVFSLKSFPQCNINHSE